MLRLADDLGRLPVAVSQEQRLDFSIATGIKTQPKPDTYRAGRNGRFLVTIRMHDDVADLLFLGIQKKDDQLNVQPRRDIEIDLQLIGNAQSF